MECQVLFNFKAVSIEMKGWCYIVSEHMCVHVFTKPHDEPIFLLDTRRFQVRRSQEKGHGGL